MAIAGNAAARSLISKGAKPSANASSATKQAYARFKRNGYIRETKAGNIEISSKGQKAIYGKAA